MRIFLKIITLHIFLRFIALNQIISSSYEREMSINDIGRLQCRLDANASDLFVDIDILSTFNHSILLSTKDINNVWGAVIKIGTICDRNGHILRSISYDTGGEPCEALLFEFISNCLYMCRHFNLPKFHTAAAFLLHEYVEEQKVTLSLAFHVPQTARFLEVGERTIASNNSTMVLMFDNSEGFGQVIERPSLDRYPEPRFLERSLASFPRLAVAYIISFPFDIYCSVLTMLMQSYEPPLGMAYDYNKTYLHVQEEWRLFVDNVLRQLEEIFDVFVFIGMGCTADSDTCEYASQCRADIIEFMTFFDIPHDQPSVLEMAVSLLLPRTRSVNVHSFSPILGSTELNNSQPLSRSLDMYIYLLQLAERTENGCIRFFILLPCSRALVVPSSDALFSLGLLRVRAGGLGVYSFVTSACLASARDSSHLHVTCGEVLIGVSRRHLELHGNSVLPLSFLYQLNKHPLVNSYPLAMILFAVFDIYQPWKDYVVFQSGGMAYFSDEDVDSQSMYFKDIDLTFYLDYVIQISAMRSRLAPILSKEFFLQGICLSWTPALISYGQEGLFFRRYCQETSGCNGDAAKVNTIVDTWSNYNGRTSTKQASSGARVAFVTAIIGNYESSYPFVAPQTIATDSFCFRGGESPENNEPNWIVDNYPYHLDPNYVAAAGDIGDRLNSFVNNRHSFMVAKFYKMNFRLFPSLKKYDVVIWIDGSLSLTDEHIAETALELTIQQGHQLIMFENLRPTLLRESVLSQLVNRYTVTEWARQEQPFQDVAQLYRNYVKRGYSESYWKQVAPDRPLYGMWVTCFIAFNMKSTRVQSLLGEWYQQTLDSTQDQMTMSFVLQALRIHPYSLPDGIHVNGTMRQNTWYRKKASHG